MEHKRLHSRLTSLLCVSSVSPWSFFPKNKNGLDSLEAVSFHNLFRSVVSSNRPLRSSFRPRWRFSLQILQHLLFPVHQRIDVVRCQLKSVSVSNRVCRARFHAIPAENASRIVDVVHTGIAFAR